MPEQACMKVRAGHMGGDFTDVSIPVGSTVGHALRVAGLNAGGYEVRVNGGDPVDENAVLASGDTIMILEKIEGNN